MEIAGFYKVYKYQLTPTTNSTVLRYIPAKTIVLCDFRTVSMKKINTCTEVSVPKYFKLMKDSYLPTYPPSYIGR
jgi:hypothetical protein